MKCLSYLHVPASVVLMTVFPVLAAQNTLGQQPWAYPQLLENPQWSTPYIRALPDTSVMLAAPDYAAPHPEVVPAPTPEVGPPPYDGSVPPPGADTFYWDQPVSKPPPKVWNGNVELGLNGTDGNSETFNISMGGHLKAKLPRSTLTVDLDFNSDSTNGTTTANRYFLEGRDELHLGESPWSFFVHGSLELDQFKAFDSRVAADAGLSYAFFKNDVHHLIGRIGAGASREIGGPDDSWIPEGTFGLEYERQISKRQKISTSAEYFPSWSDFADYRLVARANWEILLDPATHLSLKLGVVDNYDSTPNSAEPNDVDYSSALLWTF